MADSQGDVDDRVRRLEQLVGIPENAFAKLPTESDWSYVIKAHAIVEAVVTHLLVESVDSRLEDIFARMQLGGNLGKLAFVRALRLLSEENIRFIDRLSAIRNSIVHKAANLEFTFEEYFARLNAGERRAAVESLLAALPGYTDNLLEADGALLRRWAAGVIHFALLALATEAYFVTTKQPAAFSAELAILAGALGIWLILMETDAQDGA